MASNATHHNHSNSNQPSNFLPSVRAANEKKMGLLHFISPANHGWHGDVRKRYVQPFCPVPCLMNLDPSPFNAPFPSRPRPVLHDLHGDLYPPRRVAEDQD